MMRQLNMDDWPDIEALLDTRKIFQDRPVDDKWHAILKDVYVKNRLARPEVFFYGYFDDGKELVGLREAHITNLPGTFAMGVSYTKAGKATERAPNSRWPQVVIELNRFTINALVDMGATVLWMLMPDAPPRQTRLIDDPLNPLSDRRVWNRETIVKVATGTNTGDKFIDDMVLVGSKPLQDQVVVKFTLMLNIVREKPLPPGAPPRSTAPPTPHEPPPRS